MKESATSLMELLLWRAKNQPTTLAYRFLSDGEYDEVSITYQELNRKARSIAASLQASTKTGDRALLLFPAGLDFISAFFGCIYARVIPIPVPAPHASRLEKSLATILRIADDATPAAALLSSSLYDAIKSQNVGQFKRMNLLVTDTEELDGWSEKWQRPEIKGKDITLLQYTSGSTTVPRGVMVSHANLLHNMGVIEKTFGLSSNSESVFWLPPYHDMGLIGGILQPLYTGFPVTLIPHLVFLQRPFRWLQTISRFHATVSGGPNFAYDLCLSKIRPEQREQLDLSSWEIAFNGAEPIYYKTLEQFTRYFAPCGFRGEVFSPCYGLAEATLMVVGSHKGRSPIMQTLMKSGLEVNKVIIATAKTGDTQTLVGCGQNLGHQKIRIVDTRTLRPCLPAEIGEIWVNSPSVTSGYWNNSLETASLFGANLYDSDEGPFLRTGDLGFFDEGELYVTGRLKSLIIIDGKNFYPHDIEKTVELSHPAIVPAGCAVFSIQDSGSEGVIVVAETRHKLVANLEEVIKAVRAAIAEQHNIRVYDVRLCLQGCIPRSTSGKIRHFLCKKNFMSGILKEIALP